MNEHIKTGKEISDILSDEMVSRFQKGSLDLTRLNVLESEQWVSLSWLKEQIKDELTAHDHDPQDITSYYAGLKWFLSLLEEK